MKKYTLIFILLLLSGALIAQTRQTPPEFSAKSHQQHTMMLLGKVDLGGSVFTTNASDIVYAFIDGECRGIAHPMSEHNGLIFLSIAENTEQHKPITFMVWLDDRQELHPLNETLSFEPLAAVGDLNNPFIFTLDEMVGVDEADDGIWIGEPYPNPFTEQTVVPYRLSATAKLKVTVFNNMGQLLKDYTVHHDSKGTYHLEINKETMQPGIYKLLFQVETGQRILNFSKSVVLIY